MGKLPLTYDWRMKLFGTEVPAISKHIKNNFSTGELQAKSTISKMEIVQIEGSRTTNFRTEHSQMQSKRMIPYLRS